MSRSKKKRHSSFNPVPARKPSGAGPGSVLVILVVLLVTGAVYFLLRTPSPQQPTRQRTGITQTPANITGWTERALAVTSLFHKVYTPCWEGAYGAIGDAYLFALTGDSSLYRFHIVEHDLRKMCDGTWVDDEAWVCLAELKWWESTGKGNMSLVSDAVRRYKEVRGEGRLSSHEGFWTWYNWPPGANVGQRIFTNSNMDQMVAVACGLFQATGDREYLKDALMVWNGDGKIPGIELQWYKGKGLWSGRHGRASFGEELPWEGLGCASLAAVLFRATGKEKYREIAVATARRVLDPATGWVDPNSFYQIRMDGNGAFVNFLFDAYAIAPRELAEVPQKVERMLEHVWTNHEGRASVTLHRLTDHGIRNGWNPDGGEDGYGVGEIGTVHAQGEAVRAFGVFAYFKNATGGNSGALGDEH
jgi:hypothetical protein